MVKDFKYLLKREQRRIAIWFWTPVTLVYLVGLMALIDYFSSI